MRKAPSAQKKSNSLLARHWRKLHMDIAALAALEAAASGTRNGLPAN